jgi:hypothetical protein
VRALVLTFAVFFFFATGARAVPAFAVQTGQQCQTCHVGGFGPQLTPFGRTFKLNGYTLRTKAFTLPFAAAAAASYVRTAKAPRQPPAPGFKSNDNLTVDQVNLFLAGGLGPHLGGFAQLTWDGVAKAWAWDNLDLRAVTHAKVKGADILLGVSVNNNPTVEDPWNTLPAWGFPYTRSALAPSPAAAPLIDGALAQRVLGATAYAWIGGTLYLAAGELSSPDARTVVRLGVDPTAPGLVDGSTTYGRVALQRTFGTKVFEVGGFGLASRIFPMNDRSTGKSDRYRDVGLDASFYAPMGHGDVVTANARYIHESERFDASRPLDLASNRDDTLDDFRADISYYWRDRIGLTVQAFDTTGSADALLNAMSRTSRPNSSGVTFQIDTTPFGDGSQPHRRANLRVGLQYTLFTRFNGAATNFDGLGGRAGDEDTFRVFTWVAF